MKIEHKKYRFNLGHFMKQHLAGKSIVVNNFLSTAAACLFLIYTNVFASESNHTSALADANFDAAYKNCELFKFDNENDRGFSSTEQKFHNLEETYWTQGSYDMCKTSLIAPTLMPLSNDDAPQGSEYVTINIKRRGYLPGHDRCEGRPDYDNCLEKAVFLFFGFIKDDKGRWRMQTYDSRNGTGISLEQSMSETIDGVIERDDGITVIGEWKYPFIDGKKNNPYYASEPWEDFIVFRIIRRAPFGYITVGENDAIVIPVERTPESIADAVTLINRITRVVQSVRMENRH